MTDESPKPTADRRAAKVLNWTMLTILGLLGFGFCLWALAESFGRIRPIYASLSKGEQRDVFWFLFIVGMSLLIFGRYVRGAAIALRRRLKRP